MNEQQPNFYSPYPYYFYPQPAQAYYPSYGYRKESNSGQMQQQPPPNQTQNQGQNQGQKQGQGAMPPGMNNNNNNMLPTEQSYIENILRLNKGKKATVYMTFEDGTDGGKRQVFKGEIEAAGRDHIILSDQDSGMRYLLLMVYLDYVTFDEPINYSYPYTGASGPMENQPPR